MINVIILTENKKYQVLDVPENGKLYINEPHLISAITQNGVLMVPYGDVLTPFEIYALESCMSVSMVTRNLMHQGGRLLDFAGIELLQQTETMHPSSSGSVGTYTPPEFTENGLAIKPSLILGGLNFQTPEEATDFLYKGHPYTYWNSAVRKTEFVLCNSVSNIAGTNLQQLSVHYNVNEMQGLARGMPTTHIEDIGYNVLTLNDNYNLDGDNLEFAIFPNCTEYRQATIPAQPKLKYLDIRKVTLLGASELDDKMFKSMPVGSTFKLNRVLETINAGGEHASIQWLRNNARNPNVEYFD